MDQNTLSARTHACPEAAMCSKCQARVATAPQGKTRQPLAALSLPRLAQVLAQLPRQIDLKHPIQRQKQRQLTSIEHGFRQRNPPFAVRYLLISMAPWTVRKLTDWLQTKQRQTDPLRVGPLQPRHREIHLRWNRQDLAPAAGEDQLHFGQLEGIDASRRQRRCRGHRGHCQGLGHRLRQKDGSRQARAG